LALKIWRKRSHLNKNNTMGKKTILEQDKSILSVCEGPLLGEIPYVGQFLSGVFDVIGTESFNTNLLKTLNTIEVTLENLTSELKKLSARIDMLQLYGSDGNAQFKIEGWYTNDVKNWLKGDYTGIIMKDRYISIGSGAGLDIYNDCTNCLDDVNSAILGGVDFNSKKWLEVAIKCFLATDDTTRAKQSVSFVETTYKYFLKLVHLQMTGITCLRAINSDHLGLYTQKVLSNIIQQGIVCQSIVDGYMDNEQFTWYGNAPTNLSINYIPVAAKGNGYFSLVQMNATGAAAGIEFGWPEPGGNQWGISMASAQLTSAGGLKPATWAPVQGNPNVFQNLKFGMEDIYMNISTHDITLPAGQVITGLQPFIEQTEQICYGHVNNAMSVGVISQGISADGRLNKINQTKQQPTYLGAMNSGLQYITATQFSLLKSPAASSPLTGFGFCQNGNQYAIKLQTSIHSKAFSPIFITSGNYISIYNPVLKAYLTYNNTTNLISFEKEKTYDLTQNFQFQGGSIELGSPKYRQNCGIVYSGPGGPLSLIAPAPGQTGVSISFGSGSYANGDENCGWMLENPANLSNDYGTDRTPNIYNWSAALLQNLGRFLQADTSNKTATMGNPTLITNGTNKVQSVTDSSYMWNIIPGNIM
jgi:hypothetical protein